MKKYPSISKVSIKFLGKDCIGFDKLDGSNIFYEYSKNQGWYKFGTRHRLFDKSDPDFGCAIDLFLNKYSSDIEKIIFDNFKKPDNFIVFGEFFGPHSFAGLHNPEILGVENNSPKDIVIFDVNVHKKGFILPRDFLKFFGKLHIPDVIYEGKFNEEFIKDVREGKYAVEEGVVVKGGNTVHELWLNKVKTYSYLKKLQEKFGVGYKNYWE